MVNHLSKTDIRISGMLSRLAIGLRHLMDHNYQPLFEYNGDVYIEKHVSDAKKYEQIGTRLGKGKSQTRKKQYVFFV